MLSENHLLGLAVSVRYSLIILPLLFATALAWLLLFKNNSKNDVPDIQDLKTRADAESCGFIGNSDIYGIGIRVGLYTQYLTVWLGSDIMRHKRSEATTAKLLFMSSMFICLVLVSARRIVYAIEAFLMLQMVLLSWFIGPVADANQPSYIMHKGGLEGRVLSELVMKLAFAYNVWFWWKGLDRLSPTPCGTYGLYLVFKIDLYGRFRILFGVLAILAAFSIINRAIWHLLGGIMAIQARSLLASSMHDQIQSEATRLRGSQSQRHATASMTNGTSITSSKQGPSLSASLQNTKSPVASTTPVLNNASPASSATSVDTRATISPSVLFSSTSTSHITIKDVFQTDLYLSSLEMVYDQNLSKLLFHRFRCLGFNLVVPKLGQAIRENINATWKLNRFLFTRPLHVWSLMLVLLTLKVEGRLRGYAEQPLAINTILSNQEFLTKNWRLLHLTSQIRCARVPRTSSASRAMSSAIIGFAFWLGLVLGVELTIRWNHITGLQELGTVSQLIPFIVGCGGFIRLIYAEGKYWFLHGELSLMSTQRAMPKVPTWVEAYYDWKEYELEELKRKRVLGGLGKPPHD